MRTKSNKIYWVLMSLSLLPCDDASPGDHVTGHMSKAALLPVASSLPYDSLTLPLHSHLHTV